MRLTNHSENGPETGLYLRLALSQNELSGNECKHLFLLKDTPGSRFSRVSNQGWKGQPAESVPHVELRPFSCVTFPAKLTKKCTAITKFYEVATQPGWFMLFTMLRSVLP